MAAKTIEYAKGNYPMTEHRADYYEEAGGDKEHVPESPVSAPCHNSYGASAAVRDRDGEG